MSLSRRTLLMAPALLAPALALPSLVLPSAARAQEADPRLGDRSAGQEDAKVVVEYFSLTCSHCASFHKETWPRVKQELVATGKVRMVWRDFPLDQLALAAAQVARALPAERYEGFVGALLSSQDRWAFNRNGDPVAEIAKVAALAGMSRAQVDAAIADEGLRRGILESRLRGQQQHNVNSTPTFVFGNRSVPGALSFDRFASEAAAS